MTYLQKERDPWPYRFICRFEGNLAFAQSYIVLGLIVFDEFFMGDIWHVRIPGLKHEQIGQNAAQAAIAIQKRMNLKKLNYEVGNDKQWVVGFMVQCLPSPSYQLTHFLGR